MQAADIARVCHEANRAYCLSLGDLSQPLWEMAPDWQKNSAIAGVTAKLAKPSMTPEEQHQGWLELKIAEGWKYGPTKDPEKKLHPCMVPYGDLPAAQRAKDALFGAIVLALSGSH